MNRVGVVGASARAAVHSLARAGVSAWAIDLFADRDLKRVANCAICPAEHYPNAIPALASQFPSGPVLYTGGLENHPHIIRELASQRELWGNPPEVVERVRDPFTLFPHLANAGFNTPQLIPHGETCPAEGRWLRKPFRSGAGLGIRFARPGEPASPHHFFQEYIDGVPMSGLYAGTTLLGMTTQLIGEPWLHAKPFAYCGNIGTNEAAQFGPPNLLQLGRFIVGIFGVRAHWGIDFISNGNALHLFEINPRYTAGLEILEHIHGRAVFEQWVTSVSNSETSIGKAIYYAPHAIRFPHTGPWDADLAGDFDPWRLPTFADIPEPGSMIEAGSPVLTFFATGSTPAEVRARLQSRAAELNSLLRESHP